MLRKTPFILRKCAGNPDRTDLRRCGARRLANHWLLIHLRSMALPSFATVNAPNPTTRALREPPLFDIAGERDEVLAQGV